MFAGLFVMVFANWVAESARPHLAKEISVREESDANVGEREVALHFHKNKRFLRMSPATDFSDKRPNGDLLPDWEWESFSAKKQVNGMWTFYNAWHRKFLRFECGGDLEREFELQVTSRSGSTAFTLWSPHCGQYLGAEDEVLERRPRAKGVTDFESALFTLVTLPARKCRLQLRSLWEGLLQTCKADVKLNGHQTSAGGCLQEAYKVLQGDFEIWSRYLVECDTSKRFLILWAGIRPNVRDAAFQSLRAEGGCVLHTKDNPDTKLAAILNRDEVDVLSACADDWAAIKEFWRGASLQFASSWATRAGRQGRQGHVLVVLGYKPWEPAPGDKTVYQTIFYEELKALALGFRQNIDVTLLTTHESVRETDARALVAGLTERLRLLAPLPEEDLARIKIKYNCNCAELELQKCMSSTRTLSESDYFFRLAWMYKMGFGCGPDDYLSHIYALQSADLENGEGEWWAAVSFCVLYNDVKNFEYWRQKAATNRHVRRGKGPKKERGMLVALNRTCVNGKVSRRVVFK